MSNNGHEIPQPGMKRADGSAWRQAWLGAGAEFAEFLRSLDHEVVLLFVVELACALVQFDPAVVEGASWKMDPSIRDRLQDLASRQLAIQIRGA